MHDEFATLLECMCVYTKCSEASLTALWQLQDKKEKYAHGFVWVYGIGMCVSLNYMKNT